MNLSSRKRIYDPLTTLHLFLIQVIQSTSTKSALSYFNTKRIENNQSIVSMNNNSYCRAKGRLCKNTLKKIALGCGNSEQKNHLE